MILWTIASSAAIIAHTIYLLFVDIIVVEGVL